METKAEKQGAVSLLILQKGTKGNKAVSLVGVGLLTTRYWMLATSGGEAGMGFLHEETERTEPSA